MGRNKHSAVCLLLSIVLAGGMAWSAPVHAAESNVSSDLGAEAVNAAEAAGQDIVAQETAGPDAAATGADATGQDATAQDAAATGADAAESGVLVGYTLEEVSTFEDVSVGTLDVQGNKLVIVYYDDDTVVPLSADGQTVGSKKYSSLTQLSSPEGSFYSGYYVVTDPSVEGENNRGLIDINGEELLPCEALWIDWIGDGNEACRFIEVYYSTGETTEEDGCFISITDWTSDETHYYNGYAKVFDLVNKTFVGDIEVHNNSSLAVSDAGSSIVVEDPSGTYTVYNNSGEKVFEGTNTIYTGPDYFYMYDSGKTSIYDENGQEINSLTTPVLQLNGGSEYLANFVNDTDIVIDKEGNQILPDTYSTVFSEYNDIFYVTNADDTKNQLVNKDGKVLYETTDFIFWITNDYWYTSDDIGNTILIGPDGVISDQLKDGIPSYLVFNQENKYFVINDGDYNLTLNSTFPNYLHYGLIADRDNDGKSFVYDLFTGKKLLEQGYDEVKHSADYIYALDGTTWHTFKIHGIYQ